MSASLPIAPEPDGIRRAGPDGASARRAVLRDLPPAASAAATPARHA